MVLRDPCSATILSILRWCFLALTPLPVVAVVARNARPHSLLSEVDLGSFWESLSQQNWVSVTMSYFCYPSWAGRRHSRHHATSNYISQPVLAYQGRFEEVCFHTVAASAPLREQIALASVRHLALGSLERYQISRYSRMLCFPIMAASAQPRKGTFSPFDTRSLSSSSDISQSNPYTALEAAVYLATIHRRLEAGGL